MYWRGILWRYELMVLNRTNVIPVCNFECSKQSDGRGGLKEVSFCFLIGNFLNPHLNFKHINPQQRGENVNLISCWSKIRLQQYWEPTIWRRVEHGCGWTRHRQPRLHSWLEVHGLTLNAFVAYVPPAPPAMPPPSPTIVVFCPTYACFKAIRNNKVHFSWQNPSFLPL